MSAVKALASTLELESPDKKALWGDFGRGIDPSETISAKQVARMAKELKTSKEKVRKQYERLAPTFKLTLEWKTD